MNCPWCDRIILEFENREGEHQPSPGDVSLCGKCVEWAVFVLTAEGLKLRRALPWEREQIMARDDLAEAYRLVMDRENARAAVDEWKGR